MRIERMAPMPPWAYQYPMTITLHISSSGRRYTMDILGEDLFLNVTINQSANDLARLTERLQKEIRKIALVASKRIEPFTDDEVQKLLRPLAKQGRIAFKRVFGQGYEADVIKKLLLSKRPINIQVVSEDFYLPWECLYTHSLSEPLAIEHFWGMKLAIFRKIYQRQGAGAYVPPAIQVAGTPTVGLLTYLRLNGVREKELPFFEALAQKRKITLFRLQPLEPEKWDEDFKLFQHFWQRPMHVAHFACHASHAADDPTLSSIRLSNEFCISLEDMEGFEITINGNPLIVLNACETGQINPLYTSHFAGAFLQYGARGVVATECAVPDTFAADFIQQLYTHLLAGVPLGESLLQTRQHFWQQERNPSGLLYAMYAPPSIRLAYE